jgi:predicted GNAT family acetyltransferase
MVVRRYDEPAAFRTAITPLIGTTEARHNLVHGILGTLIDDPAAYDDFLLWLVERDREPVAAALRTPPWKIVLCDAVDEPAAAELARAIAGEAADHPGVLGNVPTVEWFVTAWQRASGTAVERQMAQGVFALEAVTPQPQPPGRPRLAEPEDAELLVEWTEQFVREALPYEPIDRDRFAEAADRLIERRRGSGAWLWAVDGEAVSLSAHGTPTPHGMRVGPVYTPPAHRGHGYATALVAHQATELLRSGRRFCFLFTDLANPTSNAIYRRIGYRRVAASMDYAFT